MIIDYPREPTTQCNKCGLRYKISYSVCPHCVGKNKGQIIRDIHMTHSKQAKKISSTGRQFFYLAIILACFLIVLF
jgi:hypothetical protein